MNSYVHESSRIKYTFNYITPESPKGDFLPTPEEASTSSIGEQNEKKPHSYHFKVSNCLINIITGLF